MNPVLSTPPFQKGPKDVAFNGSTYLIGWVDYRNTGSSMADIYATRIDQNQQVLDIGGIAICLAAGAQDDLAVACDGTDFFIVWEDARNYSSSQTDIYGARVDANGNVLDPDGILVSIGSTLKDGEPDIAFDGTNYVVVWDKTVGTRQTIFGAHVNTAGQVLDPAGLQLSAAAADQRNPSLAFDGSNFLVVWEDRRNGNYDLYGTRVSTSGTVLDPAGIALSVATQAQETPAICFGMDDYLVVWGDLRNATWPDYAIYGSRVDTGGNVLDPGGILIASSSFTDRDPSVAFDGTNYFSFWDRGSNGDPYLGIPADYDIYGSRIDLQGTVLDPGGLLLVQSPDVGSCGGTAVIYEGSDYYLAWGLTIYNGLSQIRYSLVDGSGTVLVPQGTNATVSYNNQRSPAIAFDGINYLSVWIDYRGTMGYEVYGTRISLTGNVLDASSIAIATGRPRGLAAPDVAFNGTYYLVVWEEGTSLYATRVSPSGTIVDPSPIGIVTANLFGRGRPKVCSDGTGWLVVWQDERPPAGIDPDIFGARIDADGTILDPMGFPVAVSTGSQRDPVAAFDGQNYMVVWEDTRLGFATCGIRGSRISPAGIVIDPASFIISEEEFENMQNPAITYNGQNYLVAWSYSDDIKARRVNTNGIPIDPADLTLCSDPGSQYPVKTAFDGTNYLLIWGDDRNPAVPAVYGSFLDAGLTTIETFSVGQDHPWQYEPALAYGDDGKYMAVYSAFCEQIGTMPVNTDRIWGCVLMSGTEVIPGDANCNGSVNVLDIILMVNYIMGLDPDPFCFENADVNNDGMINVQDLIGTVNVILSL